jgi:hypothetical protein
LDLLIALDVERVETIYPGTFEYQGKQPNRFELRSQCQRPGEIISLIRNQIAHQINSKNRSEMDSDAKRSLYKAVLTRNNTNVASR